MRNSVIKNRVLLIEDDKPVIETLKVILESKGYYVNCATDAEGAINELASEIPPDWVIMDYDISGLNTCKFVDKIRINFPNSKIILSSGYPEKEIIKEFSISLVDRFVAKPFNPIDLIRELN